MERELIAEWVKEGTAVGRLEGREGRAPHHLSSETCYISLGRSGTDARLQSLREPSARKHLTPSGDGHLTPRKPKMRGRGGAESEHESWLRTAAAGLRVAPDSGSGSRVAVSRYRPPPVGAGSSAPRRSASLRQHEGDGQRARERIVPVGTAARQALVRYLRELGSDPSGPIFRSRRGGPLGGRGTQQLFRRLKLRAGLPGRCSPHAVRHTFARAYLVNGGDSLQTAADSGPHNARPGEALRGIGGHRRGAAPPSGLAGRPPPAQLSGPRPCRPGRTAGSGIALGPTLTRMTGEPDWELTGVGSRFERPTRLPSLT
jgi:hypothetical protein